MSDILKATTAEQRNKLRKVKKVPTDVKAVIYKGATNAPVTMQFHRDVLLYGLWEALLYVEGYEKDGNYVEGTAVKALKEALK